MEPGLEVLVKPTQLSKLSGADIQYRPAKLQGMDTIPAYVEWRAWMATPLSGLSWLYGSSKTPVTGLLKEDFSVYALKPVVCRPTAELKKNTWVKLRYNLTYTNRFLNEFWRMFWTMSLYQNFGSFTINGYNRKRQPDLEMRW